MNKFKYIISETIGSLGLLLLLPAGAVVLVLYLLKVFAITSFEWIVRRGLRAIYQFDQLFRAEMPRLNRRKQ